MRWRVRSPHPAPAEDQFREYFGSEPTPPNALDDALSGVQRGTFVAPSRTTVRDFLELWLEGVKTEVASTAWVSYRQAVRRYINPHLGSKRLALSEYQVMRASNNRLSHSWCGDAWGVLTRRGTNHVHSIC
jgi:hypothetical protein